MIFNLLPLCFVLFPLLVFLHFWNRPRNLPPGPWGLPLVGHLIFLGKQPYRTLLRWKKDYGSIIYCKMGSFPVVFLCDPQAIRQALGMTELSGRADFEAIAEKENRKGIGLGEGPRQREQRLFAMRAFKESGVGKQTLENHIQEAVQLFLKRIEERLGRLIPVPHIASSTVISSLCKILMADGLSEEDVEYLHRGFENVVALGSIAGQLAMFMPWMETLTKLLTFGQLSLIKKRQDHWKEVLNFIERQVEKRNQSRVKGQPRDIVDIYLDKVHECQDPNSCFYFSYKSLPFFVTEILSAGVHTTSASTEWMFLYMASYPLVQKKIQNEIDSTIGLSRIPTLSDRARLPYMEAAIFELLRIASPAPLGLDHKCLKEVTVKDFKIPKGTLLFANIYGVHHDPQVWGPDVEKFKPERWFGEQGKKFKRDHFLAFSSGKRNCIGETLAKDTLFLFFTGIFQKYQVSFQVGDSGPGFEPIPAFGFNPAPFCVIFSDRHEVF